MILRVNHQQRDFGFLAAAFGLDQSGLYFMRFGQAFFGAFDQCSCFLQVACTCGTDGFQAKTAGFPAAGDNLHNRLFVIHGFSPLLLSIVGSLSHV
ncbi:hypothetical protein D3C80_1838520 [compost metagenome]